MKESEKTSVEQPGWLRSGSRFVENRDLEFELPVHKFSKGPILLDVYMHGIYDNC
jgi:hypothetical protein